MTEQQQGPDDVVTNRELRRQFRWQDVALVLAILGTFGSGGMAIIREARAQSDAGVAAVVSRVDELERSRAAYRKDVEQQVDDMKSDVSDVKRQVKEAQADIRALYRFLQTGQRQERLEAPVDGGQPRRCARCRVRP